MNDLTDQNNDKRISIEYILLSEIEDAAKRKDKYDLDFYMVKLMQLNNSQGIIDL
jgi:adenine C2-methylase RlmN of 23S rRNA A2503 and tRNA A37